MDTDRMRGDDDEVNQSAQSRAQGWKPASPASPRPDASAALREVLEISPPRRGQGAPSVPALREVLETLDA